MRTLILAGLALALLAACNNRNDAILFDGVAFRTKASFIEKADRRDFVVTARPASASRAGALEAARYEATKYCIENYGTSDIRWAGDYLAENAVLPVQDDTLTLNGACVP